MGVAAIGEGARIVRIEPQRRAEVRDRGVVLLQVVVDEAAIVVRADHLRVELDRLVEIRKRAVERAARARRIAAIVVGARELRIDARSPCRSRRSPGRDRSCRRRSARGCCSAAAWRGSSRTAWSKSASARSSSPLRRSASPRLKWRGRGVRRERERRRVVRDGALGVALGVPGVAAADEGARALRVEPDRLVEIRDGAVMLAALVEGIAAIRHRRARSRG